MSDVERIRKDFMEALGRLRSGSPTHPKLIPRAAGGDLKISVTTVSLEAGHSRTLIGMDGCKYPDVRAAVLASRDQSPLQMKRSAALKAMSEELSLLRDQIRLKDSALMAALLQMDDLERRLSEYEPSGKNVVDFRSTRK